MNTLDKTAVRLLRQSLSAHKRRIAATGELEKLCDQFSENLYADEQFYRTIAAMRSRCDEILMAKQEADAIKQSIKSHYRPWRWIEKLNPFTQSQATVQDQPA